MKNKIPVFAYGVVPTNPPETYENCLGNTETKWSATRYLHYWIDENLQYQAEVRDTPLIPEGICWLSRSGISIDLRGPMDYVITRTGV